MGMLADFYAGDTHAVLEALHARRAGSVQPVSDVLAHADFGLNLHGTDLDKLSKLLLFGLGQDAVGLFDSIVHDLDANAKQDYGVHVISPLWVEAVASFPNERVDELASAWFEGIAEETGEPARPPTREAMQAVRDLLAVCRTSVSMQVPVVFYWGV